MTAFELGRLAGRVKQGDVDWGQLAQSLKQNPRVADALLGGGLGGAAGGLYGLATDMDTPDLIRMGLSGAALGGSAGILGGQMLDVRAHEDYLPGSSPAPQSLWSRLRGELPKTKPIADWSVKIPEITLKVPEGVKPYLPAGQQ